MSEESERASRFNEELGGVLGGVTFLIFGAVLLGPALKHLSWQLVLYAVLSLTLARILPVALAMIGSRATADGERPCVTPPPARQSGASNPDRTLALAIASVENQGEVPEATARELEEQRKLFGTANFAEGRRSHSRTAPGGLQG